MHNTISTNSINIVKNSKKPTRPWVALQTTSPEYIEKIFKYLLSINKETEINLTNIQILELFESKYQFK